MDCDRTLLAWLDLLQLLLEYFLDAPLRIKRGEGRDFFFWFDRVSVDWVNAAWRPLQGRQAYSAAIEGSLGSPGPIKGLLGPFSSFQLFLSTSHFLQTFLERLELRMSMLSTSIYHFSPLLQSFLHLRSVCVLPSSLIFFAKCQQQYYQRCMLVLILVLEFL